MERIVADEELTTMVREFRASVSSDLDTVHQQIGALQGQIAAMQGQIDVTHRRIDDLGHELRNRISTTETAILNEIRDLSGRLDRRFEGLEVRVGDLERRADAE